MNVPYARGWGASSRVVQHATAVANAMNQVGGAVVVTGSDGSVRDFLSDGDAPRHFGYEMEAITGSTGIAALRQLDDESALGRVKRLADINVGQMEMRQVVSVGPDASFGEAAASSRKNASGSCRSSRMAG